MLVGPFKHSTIAVVAGLLAGALTPGCALDGAGSAAMRSGRGDAVDEQRHRLTHLGIGDKVRVTVFGEAELSGTFEISPLGNVSVPLVGEVPARGLSIQGFRQTLVRHLSRGFLKDPKVSVEIASYRPFYVHGEVRTPGELQFRAGLTLRDAVAMAGGYTYRADMSSAILVREGEKEETRVPTGSTLMVLPGDNIRIPERFF
jgi:polysaccharide export outer membrane protein